VKIEFTSSDNQGGLLSQINTGDRNPMFRELPTSPGEIKVNEPSLSNVTAPMMSPDSMKNPFS